MEEQNKILRRFGPFGLGALAVAFVVGILFWGGFNWALELTNNEAFCISCHEMRDNVYEEYRQTIHFQNRTGVRATCPDCHVPKEWFPKIKRKIQASNELWHHFRGTIDTREKFLAKRHELAQHEWARMKANDSQECRNCHNYDYFDYSAQGRRANLMHMQARDEGKTCIDCHKGIAHRLPNIAQGVGVKEEALPADLLHK
ncbi:cytochrome c-type protein NapC [Hydrogenophilus islandicus]